MEQSKLKNYIKDRRAWLVFGVVLILVVLFIRGSSPDTGTNPVRQITATSVDGHGIVAPDTAFVIETRGNPGMDELLAEIKTEPAIAFDLAENGTNSFRLTPLTYLDANGSLTIIAYGKSYSFTVQNRLMLLSAFPADGRGNVPVQTGIEFTFNSKNLTVESFSSAFSISPEVNGRFDYGNGRFVYYPEEPLDYGTQYVVTLAGGLSSEDGATLGAEARIAFTTVSELEWELQDMFQLSGNGFSFNSLSSETPLMQAYIDSKIAKPDQTVAVTLHAFDGWEAYLAALKKSASGVTLDKYSASSEIDVRGLREYASFDITPVKAQTDSEYDSGAWILQFPEPLPVGWYAATFELDVNGEKATRQLLLQVSDISVFYMALEHDLLAWVNDASTGGPVSGAELEITGAYRAKGVTVEDGTARITTGQPPDSETREIATFLTIKAGDRVFVDTSTYYSYYEDDGAEARKYMSYLFTDRPIYRTTDTIHVWGMARPRSPGAPPPGNLKLVLGDDLAEQNVTLLPDGTFTATMKVENLTSGYPRLRLMTGDVELHNLYLRMEDFVKPVYTAEAAPEKPVYMLEDDSVITVGIDVSTFDGTPVSDFGVRMNSWGGAEAVGGEGMRTDKRGHASAGLRGMESRDTWYPQSYYYEFSSDEAQDENFYLYGSAYGIHRDVMLRAMPDMKSNGSRMEVTTHSVDISRIQTSQQLWEKDALKGAALSVPVKATIHKVYYEKIKTGTHYDFVNRVSVDSYRYDRVEEIVGTREFATENGSYILEGLPVSDDEACYFVKLTAPDSKGRTVATTAYLGDIYSGYGSSSNGTHRYMLIKQAGPATAIVEEAYGETRFNSQLYNYEDGENVTYMLTDNDQPVENMQGRLLYGVAQDGFSNINVSGGEKLTLPFSEELLPNYIITGAYFDGKHIFALENTHMYFNPRQRELDIKLEPDKAAYRPADGMTVTATVTNKYTGKPAADTSVVISVVDEAVFAIQEQYPDILRSMYQSIYYPYIRKYTSYLQFDLGGPGEKGGGGGDNMRKDFEDTAYFATGVTGGDGKVSFTCKLPDNITSWRLTSLALSPENHAGNTKLNVSATKEFFILPIVNRTLLEGDSFSVGVYGTGSGVDDADTVKYRVTVTGNGVNDSREVSSTLRGYAGAEFGGLKRGDYTVTIEAECGQYKDGVQLPFSVVESGVEVSLVKTFNLKDGININSLRYPVSITFYSEAAKTYNAVFSSVYQASGGGRADMRLARRYAALQFKKRGADWYNSSILEDNYSDISGSYGMLSLLPYSNPDLELTVKARLALPELVSAQYLRGLTAANIAEYEGSRAAVYLAQVLAGEPLAANLSAMLESGSDLTYTDKMHIALAMAVSGDTDGARAWYDALVMPNLEKRVGIAGDIALVVTVEDYSTSREDCTAAASLLATALGTNEAGGLARYLAEKKSIYEPYLFEQIYYLQKFAPSQESAATFSYKRDGETITIDVNNDFATSRSFTSQQLAQANFAVLSGEVYADVYYAGAPGETADESKRLIGFTKKVEPVGGEFTVGGLVKITLTPDFSGLDADIGDTILVVDDYIPTGMRFERYDHAYYHSTSDRGWYMNSRQGQRLQFTVYGVNYKGVKPLVYYARCATGGEYVVESAYITSASADTWGATKRATVQIQ